MTLRVGAMMRSRKGDGVRPFLVVIPGSDPKRKPRTMHYIVAVLLIQPAEKESAGVRDHLRRRPFSSVNPLVGCLLVRCWIGGQFGLLFHLNVIRYGRHC